MRTPFTKCMDHGTVAPSVYHSPVGPDRGSVLFAMSRSELVEFSRCPHRWRAGFKREDSDALDFGSLLDCMVLTPEFFDKAYHVRPDTYPAEVGSKTNGYTTVEKPWTRSATYCKEWEAQHAGGRSVVPSGLEIAMRALADRVSEENADILHGSKRQVMLTAFYRDDATGLDIPVKCLIDVVPFGRFGRSLFDFKTCRSAAVETWPKFVFGYGYHVQAALELDMWNETHPEDQREDFRNFGVENVKPYEPFRRLLSHEFIEIGRAFYRNALARYAKCLATGVWPGYDAGATQLDGFALCEPAPWMATAGLTDEWIETDDKKPQQQGDDVTP